MKITGNYFNTPIGKKNIQKQNGTERNGSAKQAQNMDSITISASKGQIADAQFINALRQQISAEVKTAMPAEELDSLAGQVSRGEYEIDATEIAKKILLAEKEI